MPARSHPHGADELTTKAALPLPTRPGRSRHPLADADPQRRASQIRRHPRMVSSHSMAVTPSWMVGAGVDAPASAGTTSARSAW